MPSPASLDAKARFRHARDLAREADPRSAVLFDKWFAETLMAAEGEPDEARAAMFSRMAIALEVMADRVTWPTTIRGVTVPAKQRRGAQRYAARAARQPGLNDV
jgi:hypothetical protein